MSKRSIPTRNSLWPPTFNKTQWIVRDRAEAVEIIPLSARRMISHRQVMIRLTKNPRTERRRCHLTTTLVTTTRAPKPITPLRLQLTARRPVARRTMPLRTRSRLTWPAPLLSYLPKSFSIFVGFRITIRGSNSSAPGWLSRKKRPF